MSDLVEVKKRCTSESGSGSLPWEIIFEILVRVPVESLIEYKIVCKSWYAITKDPHFIEMHLIQSIRHRKHLCYVLFSKSDYSNKTKHWRHHIHSVVEEHQQHGEEEKYKWRAIEETNLFKEGVGLQISGSCNGLLCLSPWFDFLDPVFICNLITRECVKLPVTKLPVTVFSLIQGKQVTVSKTGLDLEIVRQEIGFGYDPLTKKYKLVRMFIIDFHNCLYSIGEIMTMGGENVWRRIEFPYTLRLSLQAETLVLKSSVYWNIDKEVEYSCPDNILAMDLRDEKFRTIKYPPSVDTTDVMDSSQVLMNLGGLLALAERDSLNNTRVWTMRNNNWMCQYTFENLWFPRYINMYGHIVLSRILGSHFSYYINIHGDRVLLRTFETQLSYYDTTERQTFEIEVFGSPNLFQISSFVPSLISPKAIMAGNAY